MERCQEVGFRGRDRMSSICHYCLPSEPTFSQHVKIGYLLHSRSANAQVNLHIITCSPEPSLYGKRCSFSRKNILPNRMAAHASLKNGDGEDNAKISCDSSFHQTSSHFTRLTLFFLLFMRMLF